MAVQEWKSFDIMSVAKISAVLGAIFGFLSGLVGMFAMSALTGYGLSMMYSTVNPIAGLIGGAIGGFIMGAIGAFLYNIVVGYVGGIKVRT